MDKSEDIVKLNVGGKKYITSKLILNKFPNSVFSKMFNGKFNMKEDERGYCIIDRDGEMFSHILRYLRDNQLPPESIALNVYQEAQYFNIDELIKDLEFQSAPIITLVRRRRIQSKIISKSTDWILNDNKLNDELSKLNSNNSPSTEYDRFLITIIRIASNQFQSFKSSKIVITEDHSAILSGFVPCYNCNNSSVDVNHTCTFNGLVSVVVLKDTRKSDKNSPRLSIDDSVEFVVDDLRRMGFNVHFENVMCSFSKRCDNCIISGLYSAEGILAPKTCPNLGFVIKFNWLFD